MIRALAVAAGAGALWGAAIPVLILRFDATSVLLTEAGRFLAVAWLLGLLARDWRAGAAGGAAFSLCFAVATEAIPWQAGWLDVAPEDAESIASGFDAVAGVHLPALAGAVVVAAAGGLWHSGARARATSAAVLAGALAADLIDRLGDPLQGTWDTWLAAGQAAAGLGAALLATRGARVALLAAVLPVALVAASPSLLGDGGAAPIEVVR